MAINSEQELEKTISQVGKLLQEIQDYVGRDFTKTCRIRFPRGYIRTASQHRKKLPFVKKKSLQSNLAYTMLLSDVLDWLLVRTDITGTAEEIVIKTQLFLLGTLVESITNAHLKGKCGKNYVGRIEYLEKTGVITSELRSDLEWLWKMRNRMHLFQINGSEYYLQDYTAESHNRAGKAFQKLLESLS